MLNEISIGTTISYLKLYVLSAFYVWSLKGNTDHVCLNKASITSPLSFHVQSPQVISQISFNESIHYILTNISYTYDNTTWYHFPRNEDILQTITVNLYTLGLRVYLQSTDKSIEGCFGVTINTAGSNAVPNINVDIPNKELIDVKEVNLVVSGQQSLIPHCFIFDEKDKLPVTQISETINNTLLVVRYRLVISKADLLKPLCNACVDKRCRFSVSCSVSYPGSKDSRNVVSTLITDIVPSKLLILSKSSNSSYLHLSGKLINEQLCEPRFLKLSFQIISRYYQLESSTFTLDFDIGTCAIGELTITTYTMTNITSESSQSLNVNTDVIFDFDVTLLDDKKSIIVSWNKTTCLKEYDLVEISYSSIKSTVVINVTSNSLEKIITVEPKTTYNIKIRLLTDLVASDYSEIRSITTPMGVPQVPGPLITTSLRTIFNIEWKYDILSNITFNVSVTSFRPYDSSYKSKHQSYITNFTNIIDQNFKIETATQYVIRISAFNGMYYSNIYTTSLFSSLNLTNPLPQLKSQADQTSSSTVTITIPKTLSIQGPVEFYEIIVSLNDDTMKITNLSVNYTTFVNQNLTYYIAVRTKQLTGSTVIGDEKTYLGYFNAPLQPNTDYTIFLRYKSIWNSQSQISPIAADSGLKVKTEPKPEEEESESLSAGVKAAIIVSAILLVFILFFCWVCYQVRKHRNHETTETSKDYNTTLPRKQSNVSNPGQVNLAYELDSVNNSAVMGFYPLKYDVDKTIKPVSVSDFPNYLAEIKTSFDIQRQFLKLRDGKEFDCKHGKDSVNVSRNRYDDIIPYDHNRFILEVDRKISDYINASYVANYIKRDEYIATQGPLPSTFNDFWKMVWLSEATTIVVLGQRIENGIIKYALYWPTQPNVEMKYGKIMAKMKCYDKHNGYNVTSIFLYKKSQPKMRTVKLFHFSAWPDREAPTKIQDLLTFRHAVHSWQGDTKAPIIIHCSAGVGRTGAFIAIDALIENLSRSQNIDIFNYVNYLRTRRMHMVQTQEQYQFIHDALLEHILGQSSDLDINKNNVEKILKELEEFDSKTNMNGYTKYFQKLNRLSSKPRLPEDCEGFKDIHSHKNRYERIVPLDHSRAKLLVAGLHVNDTYINATRINNRLISTQAPLETTCKDFWLMVYDTDTKNIVMLNNRQEGDEIFPDYFSVAETTTHGPLCVTVVSEISVLDVIVKREMILKHEDAKDDEQFITHYHLKNWPVQGPPDSINSVIYVVNELLRSNASEPTVIHCNDGFDRTGCLLACLLCTEKFDEFDHVTVDDVIILLRERHDLFIDTIEKYEFVYEFLKAFLTARYSGVTYI